MKGEFDRIAGVPVTFVDNYLDPDVTDELEKQLSETWGAVVWHFV